MKKKIQDQFVSIEKGSLDFAARIIDRELYRMDDAYLEKLSSNMRSTRSIGRRSLLSLNDYEFLIEVLEKVQEAAEHPYLQATIDDLHAAPWVTEERDPADADE